ncbi:hypothetical protein [Natrarchaeobius oligotrophus]|uniref:hypothetical protein n=1 Tax=Natrarchaeobius oligotrophus TaxID=3455743 RepID=UPI000F53990D|nr:hypothetical protein [Natrarchaeobius chitinivorans]
MAEEDKVKGGCVYNRRTAIKAFTSAGIGTTILSSPVSASDGETVARDKRSEPSRVEENIDDEYLERIDDIEEFENLLDDEVVFKTDREESPFQTFGKERTITLPIDNDYVTVELTLADGPSYIEVYVLGILTIEGNFPNGSFVHRKFCGDVGAAYGCIETHYDQEDYIFEYEMEIDYFLGSWNHIYLEDTVDLEEECDCSWD